MINHTSGGRPHLEVGGGEGVKWARANKVMKALHAESFALGDSFFDVDFDA